MKQELSFLRQRLYWLCWAWEDYRTLFIRQENIDLLRSNIGSLSSVMRRALLDSIQLDICALTDPGQTGSNMNLSMHRLIAWGRELGGEPGDLDAIRQRLDEARRESERLRDRRNKLIAHYDLSTISSGDQVILEWPTVEEISSSINLLIQAMNAGESMLGEPLFEYSGFDDDFRSGANSLLNLLQKYGGVPDSAA